MSPPDLIPDAPDPRAGDRQALEAEPATATARQIAERARLGRALSRARRDWPAPTPELIAWARQQSYVGGGSYTALAAARARWAGLELGEPELALLAAGLAHADPELVTRHMRESRRA